MVWTERTEPSFFRHQQRALTFATAHDRSHPGNVPTRAHGCSTAVDGRLESRSVSPAKVSQALRLKELHGTNELAHVRQNSRPFLSRPGPRMGWLAGGRERPRRRGSPELFAGHGGSSAAGQRTDRPAEKEAGQLQTGSGRIRQPVRPRRAASWKRASGGRQGAEHRCFAFRLFGLHRSCPSQLRVS